VVLKPKVVKQKKNIKDNLLAILRIGESQSEVTRNFWNNKLLTV
jgi:hypothetical protein